MSNPFYLKIRQIRKLKKFLEQYPSETSLIEELYMKAILESYPRVKAINGVSNYLENGIRNEFVRDFKNSSTLLKTFIQNKTIVLTAENQVNTADLTQRTDIEFHCTFHEHTFVVECKRLSSAESRYVHGRKANGIYKIDGMEKFIHLIYSKDDRQASMVSFVVKGDVDKITNSLKAKIEIAHPSTNMDGFISKKCLDWNSSFQSEHLRSNNCSIHLYHLFLDFK